MPTGLRASLSITDVLMLLYWSLAALAAINLITLPVEAMYAGYGTPVIDAWNWSFAPLDLAFAATGLTSVHLARRGDGRWRGLALISLTLTLCAGGMAVTFWTLMGTFDLSWWLPNLALLLLPMRWLPRLLTV